MFEQNNDLGRIKSGLADNIGQRVQITEKKGRKKIVTSVGTIESTHPSIFTIKLECNAALGIYSPKRVSFSYTDVLTRTVELMLLAESSSEDVLVSAEAVMV